VLDLLDDAISDDDLKSCIHLSQLDGNRFRLAGDRAREVLARDFGSPFDLRAYMSTGDRVTAALSSSSYRNNNRADGFGATNYFTQQEHTLGILSELPVRNACLLSKISSEHRTINRGTGLHGNDHRRVQSASPRIPVTTASYIKPSAASLGAGDETSTFLIANTILKYIAVLRSHL